MTQVDRQIRALALLSGSLDSQLAIRVLQDQCIAVHAVTFSSPFFDAGQARSAADRLEVPLRVEDFTVGMVRVLSQWERNGDEAGPPCAECRTAMLERAAELRGEEGYHLVSTGEVLNQRSPAQEGDTLQEIDRRAGCWGYVLRPLSAALLPETEPERLGWINREKLFGFEGRSRRAQIELADQWGIRDYPPPATVCRLTESSFVQRVTDLREHEGLRGVKDLQFLRLGRHFRLGTATKLVVGRNQHENAEIEGAAELYDLVLRIENVRGPTGILPFTATPEQIRLAAAICARYSDADGERAMCVRVRSARESHSIEVAPADEEVIDRLRI